MLEKFVMTAAMQVTIELSDIQRAKLLEIGMARGEHDFSVIVQEAIEQYLDSLARRRGRIDRALAVLGTLDEAAADALEASTNNLRTRWRA